MARYARGFFLVSAATTHERFQRAIAAYAALERASPGSAAATVAQLERAYGLWQIELERIAAVAAKDATAKIIARLEATRRRPETQVKPRIRDNIVSRPLGGAIEAGSVGVADIAALDRVVNPFYPDYGPYWRAQEDGSRAAVGKLVQGYFYEPGFAGAEVPRAAYRGGRGPHPIFVTASRRAGPLGGKGGPGLIRHPVPARHFVRDGAGAAALDWKAALRANERDTIAQIAAIVRPGPSPAVRRRRTGRARPTYRPPGRRFRP